MKIIIQRVKKPKWISKVRFREKSIKVSYCWSVLAQMTRRKIWTMLWESLSICGFFRCRRQDESVCQGYQGEFLSISQFTLFADTKKGNRPAFTGAAKPDMATAFYDIFNQKLAQEVPVQTGVFGADMQVELVNDGPVTIILDTKIDKKTKPSWLGFCL